jgi:hypothetical protein
VGAGPASSEHVPDAIEPIVAYRIWMVGHDLNLTSLNGQTTWPPDAWAAAQCSQPHRAPDEACTCGLYSLKLEEATEKAPPPRVTSGTSPAEGWDREEHEGRLRWPTFIVGKVQLAGKVIEHDRGYRAERARLVEVLPESGTRRQSSLIADRYGVPLGPERSILGDPFPPGGSGQMGFFDMVASAAIGLVLLLAATVLAAIVLSPVALVAMWMHAFAMENHLEWANWWVCCITAMCGPILFVCVGRLIAPPSPAEVDVPPNVGFVCSWPPAQPAELPPQDLLQAAAPDEPPIPDSPRPY